MDVLTPEQRRLNMSRIRDKNTYPERVLRSALHARGIRFSLHDEELPGKPDLVMRRRRLVVFVNGCFWHWHGCHMSKLPATRTHFWSNKIRRTKLRDKKVIRDLRNKNWRVAVVWECALRGSKRIPLSEVCDRVMSIEALPAGSMRTVRGKR